MAARRFIDVKIRGEERVLEVLDLYKQAAQIIRRRRIRIQNPKPYTHWIEEGFYRGGRPGKRKAGPARMMEKGAARIRQIAKAALVRAIPKGRVATERALAGVIGEGTKTVRENTPVRSGDLRAAFYTVTTER